MRMLDQLMRFGVIWDFLWIHTVSYQLLMIPLPSGTLLMRPLLLLLMLHFLVLIAKLALLVVVLLLPLAVLLQVAKRSLMRMRRPKKKHPSTIASTPTQKKMRTLPKMPPKMKMMSRRTS